MKYFENRIKCGTTTVHMRQLLLSIAWPSMKSITLQLFIGGEGEEKDMFTPATQTLGRTNTIFQKILMLFGFALMHTKLESNLACKLNAQLKPICSLDI